MDNPLISIVIANYNYGRFLEDAIKSVVTQDGAADVELIICDAGSTDNSVEIIRKYAGGLPPNTMRHQWVPNTSMHNDEYCGISWWCSEKDYGQSDAFNKGFAMARGRYLTWLNSDDILVEGCLRKVIKVIKGHPSGEWFTGNMFRFADDGRVIECPWGAHYLPMCLQRNGMPPAVYGPTSFFSKRLFEQVGRMKTYQHFMMDIDLWMRFIMAGAKQYRISCFCWAFRMHEASKTAEFGDHKLSVFQRERFDAERIRCYSETGYKVSPTIHLILLLWRFIDGSLLKGLWLKLTFREFNHNSV